MRQATVQDLVVTNPSGFLVSLSKSMCVGQDSHCSFSELRKGETALGERSWVRGGALRILGVRKVDHAAFRCVTPQSVESRD